MSNHFKNKSSFKVLSFLNSHNSLFTIHYSKSILAVLFIVLSLFVANNAHAGTIIKGPAYLGLTRGLVGCWTFDGAYLKAPDCSGNNNTGTLTNGPTKVAGKVGQGLDFDGSNDFVTIDTSAISLFDLAAAGKYSWSFWIKPDNFDEYGAVFTHNSGGANNVFIYAHTTANLDDGPVTAGISLVWQNGGNVIRIQSTDNVLKLGRWDSLLVTYDGSLSAANRFTMYVNGADVTDRGDVVTTGTVSDILTADLLIGKTLSAGELFNGTIDETRFYDRLLSATEIARLYRIGLGSTANRSSTSLLRGLVGCWTFDGLYTKAPDCSGNNNVGTLNGGTSLKPAAGKVGQALSFDGSNDYVSIDNESPFDFERTQAFTLSAWVNVNPTQATKEHDIIEKVDATFNGYGFFRTTTGTLEFIIDQPTLGSIFVITNSATLVPPGQWKQVVATYTGSSTEAGMKIYVDGVAVAITPNGSDPLVNSILNNDNLLIGDDIESDGCCNFGGKIDEVRIYNRALSAGEIARLYQTTQSKFNSSKTDVLAHGLVGCWTFDGLYTKAPDCSGNNNVGTITGATKKPGKIGQALNFDGVNSNVNIGNANSISNLTSRTISAWIYPRTLGEGNFGTIIYSNTNTVNWFIQLCTNTGSECPSTSNTFTWTTAGSTANGIWYAPANSIKLNQWQHIVIEYTCGSDSNNPLFFLNGQQVTASIGTTPNGTASLCDDSGSDKFKLIGDNAASDTNFDGLIDDVRIYNRALSASEIQIMYNMGR